MSSPPPEAVPPLMSSLPALSRALCKSASRPVAVTLRFLRECVGITAAVDDKRSASKENVVTSPFLSELPARTEEGKKLTDCVSVV